MLRLVDAAAAPGGSVDDGPPTVTRLDGDRPRYLAARLDRLVTAPHQVHAKAADADPHALHAAGLEIARAVADEWPGAIAVDGDDVSLPHLGLTVDEAGSVGPTTTAWNPGESPPPALRESVRRGLVARLERSPWWARRLEAITASVQEDLVIVGADGRAHWLHVAFPSGWDPGAMGGASFERLHAPAPHADALLRAAPGIVRAMVHKGPFLRHVWGVSAERGLCAHPDRRRAPTAHGRVVESHSLRVERQTTLPLGRIGLGAFFIGVYVTPLAEVVAVPERRAALAEALGSMDDDLLRYKGLAEVADRLAAELREAAGGAGVDRRPS